MRWPRRSTCSPSRTACAWPRRSPGVECLLVTADGQVRKSAGWSRYERPSTALADQATPVALAQGPTTVAAGILGRHV